MMLVEIQEEFMAIILDIHLWRMLLDFAITCRRGLSQEKKVEDMKIMDEEYHQLFKDLRRESHALQQAVVEDKETIISRISSIVELHGSTSGLVYLQAIYLQSWLTGSIAYRDMDLRKCELLHLLGQGGSGVVMKVKWLGIECALKMLDGQDEKEATTLKGLFHPNIIRLFHYWKECPENPQSCLLMELMPQDLGAYMRGLLKNMSSSKMQMGKDNMPFSLPVAIDIMYQIAQALRYMHDKHLTHRDLKPANILVKERLQMGLTCVDGVGYLDIKLADFGLVKSYNNTSTFQAHSKNKGTGMYRAPEMIGKDIVQKRHYLPKVDVWSFGITCAEILSGKQAYGEYSGKSALDIQTMICKEGLRLTLPKCCPPYLAFCIKSCWEYLPSWRPTFANICKLLRHAQLLSLGVTKLDDSKVFFAYPTRSDQMQSLSSLPSSSKTRISTFLQTSLKFMRIGPRPVANATEVLPVAAIMHKERVVSTPMATEDNPELDEDIGGGIATLGSLTDGERHYSAVLPVTDILYKERVVSTPMVTEENPLADDVIAGSIATLANPTQVVKSLPDLQEPAQLTQPSLGIAISPLDASNPIQPATIPQKNLEKITLMTKADGPILCRQNAVKNFLGNHPKRNPDRKNKKPIRLSSNIETLSSRESSPSLMDWLESRSAEQELPKFHKAAHARHSPSTLSWDWNQSIMLPKPSLPVSPSSSRRDHNNGSQEAVGFQFPAPPPRSYPDDDTGPSLITLWVAVMGVKNSVIDFVEVLITNMNKHPVELEYLKQRILREVRAGIDEADHWKFLVQAFICKQLFDGFDAPNQYFGVEYFENDLMTKLISFADFSKFKDKASTISMLLDSDSPDDSFLGRFCFKKFKSIFGQLPSNRPLPIYQEEWDAIERECHPKTVFYRNFLKVAVSVWLLHSLVHSFEEKVEMLIFEKGVKFERQTMESVVPGSSEEDEEVGVNIEVGFSVIPGFQLSRSVVTCCEVYLRSRNRHTNLMVTGRTSTKKTPVQTFSNEPPGKTLSAKTSGTLHTSELPVCDNELPICNNNDPRSLRPSEALSSSSHYVDYYSPARVGDDGSSGLAVREANMFWDAQQEGLIPGNQGGVSRSGRQNIYEQDNFQKHSAEATVMLPLCTMMPAPPARPSNPRQVLLMSLETRKCLELWRLSNTGRNFPSL